MEELRFAIFSDLHYKKGQYVGGIGDLDAVFARAKREGAQFVLHTGDLCNDYRNSPELIRAWLRNREGLPAYGCYGNHELENAGNSMEFVTPLLTNRADAVVWGTPDGKIGDGRTGYYHFDCGNFRFVITDTSYSLAPDGTWEHNRTDSHHAPEGNLFKNCLGVPQLLWLDRVITDAASRKMHVIVCGHAAFFAGRETVFDAAAVQAIYKKADVLFPGCVLLSVNGHYHMTHVDEVGNVLFLDMNAVRNSRWIGKQTEEHYKPNETYLFTDYDSEGNPIKTYERPLNELTQSKNAWFTADPLSAIVTVRGDGSVSVRGTHSTWLFDCPPPEYLKKDGVLPEILDYEWKKK